MNTRQITTDYRMAKWVKILQDRKTSGVSVKAYCQMNGFSKDAYYYWQKKLREAACKQLAFMPAEAEQKGMIKSGFTEIKLRDSLPEAYPSESGNRNSLHIKVSDVRIDAGNHYPADKLAYLLRELVRQC